MRIMIFIISVLVSIVLLAVYEISILVMLEYTDLNQKQVGMLILLVFSNYCVYNKIIEDIFSKEYNQLANINQTTICRRSR